MAVTLTGATLFDASMAQITWESDRTPPLEMVAYLGGREFARWKSRIARGAIVFPVAIGEYPFIEICDHPSQQRTPALPGRVLLHWAAVSGAVSYRVEEYVASVWTTRAAFGAVGISYYAWLTRWLEDSTSHQFRVVSVDAGGNETVGAAMAVEMRRHPDLPQVAVTVNSGGTLTIS